MSVSGRTAAVPLHDPMSVLDTCAPILERSDFHVPLVTANSCAATILLNTCEGTTLKDRLFPGLSFATVLILNKLQQDWLIVSVLKAVQCYVISKEQQNKNEKSAFKKKKKWIFLSALLCRHRLPHMLHLTPERWSFEV